MAKHKFWLKLRDEANDKDVGIRCGICGQTVIYVNGVIPLEKLNEECQREDVNQAAARVVRERRKIASQPLMPSLPVHPPQDHR